MSDIALQNSAIYAAKYNLSLRERLGFGIHGLVHVAEHQRKPDRSAIKAFNSPGFFRRERDVYERLHDAAVTNVLGFNVPQLLRTDSDLCVVEMSIVVRPFALDFAGAFLDERPHFPEDSWAEWEAQKREQFGDRRWKEVQAVMNAFEDLGIYLVDVSPSNIAFED